MKESIEDITADIEYQYGKSNTEKNIEYILSLYSERLKDGVLDDNIPVPSNEAAAKTILLILDRPELPWETICKERRVKNVMEYLFIRATGHYEEVHDFVSGLLRHYIKGITPQMVLTFMNIWKHVVYNRGLLPLRMRYYTPNIRRRYLIHSISCLTVKSAEVLHLPWSVPGMKGW